MIKVLAAFFFLMAVATLSVGAEGLTALPESAESENAVPTLVINVEAQWVVDGTINLEITFNRKPTSMEVEDIAIEFSDGGTGSTDEWQYPLKDIALNMNVHPVDDTMIEATVAVSQGIVPVGVFVRLGQEGRAVYATISGEEALDSKRMLLGSNVRRVQSSCTPQCTEWVVYNQHTNINFEKCWGKRYGNAGEWYKYAQKCGFSTSSTPKDGSIGELKSPGHVFYVISAKKTSTNKYQVVFTDSNWAGPCMPRYSVSVEYDKSTGKIFMKEGKKQSSYPVTGFITKW